MFLQNYLSDGTEIWIGRNARENDDICREMDDEHWWLHAEDIPSAHIVVCDANPSADILKEAVRIAANRFKNNNKRVRIVCVKCKYVHKKRHFSAGEVEINTQFAKYYY